MTPLVTFDADRVPFRNGHVHRPQPCMACGEPTRRTVLHVSGPEEWARTRYVLCSGCELPDPETRLLMAVFGVDSVPQLEAKVRHDRIARQEAER